MNFLDSFFEPYADIALLILRVIVGVIFIFHGLMKASSETGGLRGYSQMLSQMMKLPPSIATIIGYWHGLVEIVGGALTVLGLFTRLWMLPFGLIMLLAIFTFKIPNKDIHFLAGQGETTGWELDLVLLGAIFVLLTAGPGSINLNSLLGISL